MQAVTVAAAAPCEQQSVPGQPIAAAHGGGRVQCLLDIPLSIQIKCQRTISMPNEATATAGDLPDTAPTNAQTTAVNAHPVAVGINPTGQLATQLAELVAAAFPAIWVETAEPQEALREIHQLCHAQDWRLAGWDCEAGLTIQGEPASLPTLGDSQDPLAVIRALPEISRSASTTVLTLENLHRFLGSIELVQAIIRQAQTGKQTRVVLLVLAPLTQLPPELEKLFICLDHQLPDTPQLAEIARGVAAEADELPDNEAFDRVLDAARGLTRSEAENAFSLSLVRHGRLDPETLWQLKAQQVRKSGLLTIHQGAIHSASWVVWQTSSSLPAGHSGGTAADSPTAGPVASCCWGHPALARVRLPKPWETRSAAPPSCSISEACSAALSASRRPISARL